MLLGVKSWRRISIEEEWSTLSSWKKYLRIIPNERLKKNKTNLHIHSAVRITSKSLWKAFSSSIDQKVMLKICNSWESCWKTTSNVNNLIALYHVRIYILPSLGIRRPHVPYLLLEGGQIEIQLSPCRQHPPRANSIRSWKAQISASGLFMPLKSHWKFHFPGDLQRGGTSQWSILISPFTYYVKATRTSKLWIIE